MTCKPTESSAPPELHGAFTQQLQHLVRLAQTPGWKAYAWHRAKELDAEKSGVFAGMAEAMKAAMTGPAVATGSEAPSTTKPHSAGPKSSTQ